MKIDEIKVILKRNQDALIYIFFGMLSLLLFVFHLTGVFELNFDRKTQGHGDRKGYLIELLLYNIGGEFLILVFYFLVGVILLYIGISMFKYKR